MKPEPTKHDTSVDLLPCPFCGGSAHFDEEAFTVSCDSCPVEVSGYDHAMSQDEIEEMWNEQLRERIGAIQYARNALLARLSERRQGVTLEQVEEAVRVAFTDVIGISTHPRIATARDDIIDRVKVLLADREPVEEK